MSGLVEQVRFRRAEENPGGHSKLCFVLDTVQSRFAGLGPGDVRILDIGCGRGDLSIPLAQLGYLVHGIDLFEPRIAEARAHAPRNATFEVRNAEDLDPHAKYDAILCVEIIEHLKDPQLLLRAIRGLLRPDGILIITVPNGYSLLEIVLRLKLALKRTAPGRRALLVKRCIAPVSEEAVRNQHEGDFHLQHFTPWSFRGSIRQAGFHVTAWQNAGPLYSLMSPFGLISVRSRSFREFDQLDTSLASYAPKWCAGGWYVSCVHAVGAL